MQTEVSKTIEQIKALQTIKTTLEARKQAALTRIEILQAALPHMLVQLVTGECSDEEIMSVHNEIIQLQQIVYDPIQAAIKIASNKELELRLSSNMLEFQQEQKSQRRHQQYVDTFNRVFVTKTLSVPDKSALLHLGGPTLRTEVEELARQVQAYRSATFYQGEAAKFEDFVTIRPTLNI